MFVCDYIDGKKIIKSSLIDEIEVFFTTRESCIYSKEEDRTFMKERVEKFLSQKLATNHPVHGVNIEEVIDNKYFYKDVDGLLLKKGKAGFLNFGDCVPLVFYVKGVGLISHAGWRGTTKCMAKISVERLIKETQCEAKDIKVIIGPSICSECYEVGKNVYDELLLSVGNSEKIFCKKDGKFFVDLKGINKQQLVESGVKMIDICPYCTNCSEKLFYSYRYEKTGYRHSAVVRV